MSNQLVNTDRDLIENEILPAILSGETNVTRRCEIYESDGVTQYLPGVFINVTSGSVPLSQGSDSRRTIDLTIDNSDEMISHDPNGGLWYDKILKLYRGITYTPQKKSPRIAIVGAHIYDTVSVLRNLLRVGYSDITFLPAPSISDLVPYDLVVAWSENADFTTAIKTLLNLAYNSGMAIFTMCNQISATSIPWITAVATQSGSGTATLAISSADNPFSDAFQPYVYSYASSDTYATTLANGARNISTSVKRLSYIEAANGARWFHYQPKLIPITQHDSNLVKQNILFKSIMDWLFDYSPSGVWETQIGEFMIDRITEASFPHTLEITGRDYSKKLDLCKFNVPTTFSAGLSLINILAGLANNAGITKINIGITDLQIDTDANYDGDSSMLDAYGDFAQAYTFEWFFDKTGVLIIRDYQDPISAPVSLTLQTGGTDGNLIDYDKESEDTNLYNRWVVVGESSSGDDIYIGIVTNDDPGSPSSTVSLGVTRTAPLVKSSLYRSNNACLRQANKLKSVGTLDTYTLNFDALVAPWIEVGEILQFIDPDTTDVFPVRMLFTDGTIPLDLGLMSGTGKRVAIIDPTGVVNS